MLRRVSLGTVAAALLLCGFGCLWHRCGDHPLIMSRVRGEASCQPAGSGSACFDGVPVGRSGGSLPPGAIPDGAPAYMLPQPTPGSGGLLPPQQIPSTPYAPPSVAPAPPEALNVLPAPGTPGTPVKIGK